VTEASSLQWPLQWPIGRPRIQQGRSSRFKTDFLSAVQLLRTEARRLGADHLVISSNMELRPNGLPYMDRREPEDEGVAVYFIYKEQPMCFACDMWDKVGDNIYAIARTMKALRGIERWGAGEMFRQAFTAFTAPSMPKSPHEILGVRPDATRQEIDAAYRRKAKLFHPDAPGGSDSAMVALNKARDTLKGRAA
jgi:DnaJ-like protein